VNDRKFSSSVLRTALKEAQSNNRPIQLLIENAQFFKTYPVVYHDGDKNPHLEPVAGEPDILGNILKPLTR
jgi:hypothetical protein